ncbi:unnamed protein product [Prorocentrum cordatum]|uniref:Phospholipid scramblase n=1 Tax=Prorocentrum cordatum TaxID=2364126 RepID=A0ABN9QD43_9DINO|nr:unnamed protein product [Polarella glacialis]
MTRCCCTCSASRCGSTCSICYRSVFEVRGALLYQMVAALPSENLLTITAGEGDEYMVRGCLNDCSQQYLMSEPSGNLHASGYGSSSGIREIQLLVIASAQGIRGMLLLQILR